MPANPRPTRRSSLGSSKLFRNSRGQKRALAYEQLENRRLMVTNIWSSSSGGLWSDGSKWSRGVPQEGQDVQIGTQSVTFDSSVSPLIGSLTTNGRFAVSNSSKLRIVNAFNSTNSVSIGSGALLEVGQLSATGSVSLALNTTLSFPGSGTLRADGGVQLGGGNAKLMNATVHASTSIIITTTSLQDASILSNVTTNGPVDLTQIGVATVVQGTLTLNNKLTIGQGSILAFSGSSAALQGTGSVFFENKRNNEIQAVTDGMTLTIGPGMTIHGGNTQVGTSRIGGGFRANTTLRVEGKIIADPGMKIRVSDSTTNSTPLANTLQIGSNGSIRADGGTLDIAGKISGADVSKITQSTAGTINLVGQLDNTGRNWNLADGPWNFVGGSIIGGTITQSTTKRLVFTSSRGTLTNVTFAGNFNMGANTEVTVLGDLTLTGGTLELNNKSKVYFNDLNSSLLGDGTVVFLDNAECGLITQRNGMTLTIGKDVTIRGGHSQGVFGFIGNPKSNPFLGSGEGQNTNVIIKGKVIADQPGRQIGIRPTNKLINLGLIEAKSGFIAMSGYYTREDLGDVRNSEGGIVKIDGTLDNRGKTLSFDSVTGSWSLVNNGIIVGGTILQGSNKLLFTSFGGTLDGVTIDGDINLDADSTEVTIVNGLTLNGKATLGDGSKVIFSGEQTLDGRANIIFNKNVGNNALNLDGKNMTLTIGPEVVIIGGSDRNGSSQATIGDKTVGTSSPTVILNGSIVANNSIPAGVIRVDLPGGKLVANGKLESRGGDVHIVQAMTLPAAGSLISPGNGSVTFKDNVSFEGSDPSKIQLLGTTNFTGSTSTSTTSPQLFEGLSQDFGPDSIGFTSANYLMGTLVVKANTKLKLIDRKDNAPGTAPEAVYVNALVIEANANLNVGTLKLYYRSLTQLGSGNSKGTFSTEGGTHQFVPGGGVLPFNVPTPGTIDKTPESSKHDWTFQGTQGGRISIDASPSAGFWIRMRLLDAADKELKVVTSTLAGAAVSISNYTLLSSGTFRVVIDNDPTHVSVGNYVVTLLDTTPNRRAVNVTITSNQAQGVEYGAAIEFTAKVAAQAPTAPKATGSVQFKVDGVAFGGPVKLVDGEAKLLLSLPGAGARIVTVDFISDNGIFDATSNGYIQQIKKKVLTLKANDILDRIAGTSFTPQFTATGFITGENTQVLTGTPSLTVDPAADKTAGSYTINIALGSLVASNYSFQFSTGTMTVLPAQPFRINIVSGGSQKVIINRTLPLLHRLKVLDEFFNPIPNATVVFEAPSDGLSGTFANGQTSVSVTTSALGEAQATAFTVKEVTGSFSITATCNTVKSQFQVTVAEAGPPLEFIPLSGPISETAGTVKFSLQRNTTITSSLTVNLTSNRPEFIRLPSSSVTFPVNVDTVLVDAQIINDTIASGLIGSGPKDIEILATAGLASTILQVQVIEDDVAALTLQVSPTLREGDKASAKVSRNTSIDSDLTVQLNSGDASILTVPAVITIPAGQQEIVFDVQAVADQLAFGARTTSLSANVTGMTSGKLDVSVTDIDSPSLILEPINSTDISEKDGSTTFRLRRNSPPASSLAVGISSSLGNVVDFPTTVVIPQDSLFVDFTVATINDALAGSNRDLTVTASAGPLSTSNSMTIREDDSPTLTMTLDANTLIEGSNSSSFNVTLYRNTLLLPALTVDLAVSLPGQILLSNQVTFIAGEANAFFAVSAIDDSELEGLHSVRLTAHATGFIDAVSDVLTIEDNETLSLTQSVLVLSEKNGQSLVTVTRNITNMEQPLLVSLLSSDSSELTVPLSVTIPARATSATFFVTAVDDALLDGLQTGRIAASASGYVAGDKSSVAFDVSDQESLTVLFDTDTIDEATGKVSATISRSDIDDLSQALTITLDNSAAARVQFPSNSIVIPAGEVSFTIEGTALDNKIYEGDKLVTLSVTAAGYNSGSAAATVQEDDHAWHNYRNPLDVNNDGAVTAIDALIIINRLNTQSDGFLEPRVGVTEFIDTNLDDNATAIDVLLVINELNSPKSPEGEQATDNFFADYAADNWFDLDYRGRRSRVAV